MVENLNEKKQRLEQLAKEFNSLIEKERWLEQLKNDSEQEGQTRESLEEDIKELKATIECFEWLKDSANRERSFPATKTTNTLSFLALILFISWCFLILNYGEIFPSVFLHFLNICLIAGMTPGVLLVVMECRNLSRKSGYDWLKEARKEIKNNVSKLDVKEKIDIFRKHYNIMYDNYVCNLYPEEKEDKADYHQACQKLNELDNLDKTLAKIREKKTQIQAEMQEILSSVDGILDADKTIQVALVQTSSGIVLDEPADEVEPGGKKPYTKNM